MCLHVSSYYYICVLILMYTSGSWQYRLPSRHAKTSVFSYYYMCVLMLPYVSSYYQACYYVCVLILLYVSSYYYALSAS